MKPTLTLLLAAFLFCACASTSMNNGRIRQTKYMEGGFMSWEYVEKEPKVFELYALGAGAHSEGQVDAAFMSKAKELCAGSAFDHDSEVTKTDHSVNTGRGYAAEMSSFTRQGIVRCK